MTELILSSGAVLCGIMFGVIFIIMGVVFIFHLFFKNIEL